MFRNIFAAIVCLTWHSLRLFAECDHVEVSDFAHLYEYAGFNSVWPFNYRVPALCSEATWGFQVENWAPDSCDVRKAMVVMQYGSLPVVSPDGEKLPENFFSPHTNRVSFFVASTNKSVMTTLRNPRPGPWYGVAFLPKSDGHLKPSDLFVECAYRFKSSFRYSSVQKSQISILQPDHNLQLHLPARESLVYRFSVALPTYEYIISLNNCTHGNSTGCLVTLATRGQGLPGHKNSSIIKACESDSADCVLQHFLPEVKTWHYLVIQSSSEQEVNFNLTLHQKECQIDSRDKQVVQLQSQAASCRLLPLLDRFSYNAKFKTKFARITNSSTVRDVIVPVSEKQSVAVPFQLEDGKDTGGSLVISLRLVRTIAVNDSDLLVRVDACLMTSRIPVNVDITFCNHGYHNYLNTSEGQGQKDFKVVVPYPEEGVWFAGLLQRCYKPSIGNESSVVYQPCGAISAEVNISVNTDACLEGECNKHGRCLNFLHGQVLYTTCRCDSGWRGYDCSDGTEMKTDMNQLLEILLLTLSNVLFLPAIVVAAYRLHFVEALVYLYTMTFSALYHACDGNRMDDYKYCALPLHLLGVCDFLGSATAIWVTLVAMSRPPLKVRAAVQMAGPLGLLVGVLYKRTSAFLFLVPAGLGLLLICVGWVCRCCYRHKCYPTSRRYLVCLLPGILLAVGGLCIFTFVEKTDNYLYTHSAWHACMALCILFLLPPRESKGYYRVKKPTVPALGSTYQPIRSNDENHVI